MECSISKSIKVFEARFNCPYSTNFLVSLLSSKEFIFKILQNALCSLSPNKFKFLLKQRTSSKEEIKYQVESTQKFPVTLSFSFNDYSANCTLLKFSIELIQMTLKQETYTEICKLVIANLIKEINTPLPKQVQSLSSVIKSNRNVLWNLITTWEYASLFFKNDMSNISFEGDPQKVGSIIKCDFLEYINSECVVIKSDSEPLSDTWCYNLEPILGNIEIQEVRFIFRKISEQFTLFTVENIFKENVTYESLYLLKIKKTRLLEKIKEYFSQ